MQKKSQIDLEMLSVSLRGRNSVRAAGDEVLWVIDGVTYITPPMLSVNEVVYVESC